MPTNTGRSTRPDPLTDAEARVDVLCEIIREMAAVIGAHFAVCPDAGPVQRDVVEEVVRRLEMCGR